MKDSLGDRMKGNYEDRYRISLPRRTNVIIRIDGKAFHSYTRGLEKPYDQGLLDDMNETTKYLCENIQGAKMGYVQSDEISILLHDYSSLETDAWFDNSLQKMCSISVSLATAKFNELRNLRRLKSKAQIDEFTMKPMFNWEDVENNKLAMFDARVFVVPEPQEVVNYFIWRQQDATRNSISMAAQSMFSHKSLHGKSTNDMQNMMMLEKGVNLNDYPTRFKRGSAIKKEEVISVKPSEDFSHETTVIAPERIIKRRMWEIDQETPIFTQDRDYILELMEVQENG